VTATVTTQWGSGIRGLQTEYPFVLPRGYVDARGRTHRNGVMRLATARDEIAPQADARVRANPAYLTVVLLARTVTRLDGVDEVDTDVVEQFFAADLAFLQDLYRRLNQRGNPRLDACCPQCGLEFAVDTAGDPTTGAAGEAVGEP
jgi:hypothetical protein